MPAAKVESVFVPHSTFRVPHCRFGFSAIYLPCQLFYAPRMGRESTTLRVGDDAPDFLLTSANQPLAYQLTLALQDDPRPVLLEFLRGTW